VRTKRDSVTEAIPAWLRVNDGGFDLDIHVQPAARRSQVVGEHGRRLKLAVRAPPIEGRANLAVRELIAQCLGVRVSAVQLVSGEGGRDKRVRVAGGSLTCREVAARLLPK
jgi:uncharacterized protein (TIGR00251 family)